MPRATTRSKKKDDRYIQNYALHIDKVQYGGLSRSDRRWAKKFGIDLSLFEGKSYPSPEYRDAEGRKIKEQIRKAKRLSKVWETPDENEETS